MTPERWKQIGEIYQTAAELSHDEQCDFLDKACADDTSLRREVESLLAADAKAGNFIEEPIIKDVSSLLDVKDTPSLAGKKLGHYQILSRIGAGGMGEVYLAKDSKLGREVALKTLPEELCCDPKILQRFRKEARAAATLNHPNIATLYSVEEVEGSHFITMEYVDGKTLSEMIPHDGLELKVFLEWFISLANALSHAHEKGIIHSDIKPGNIMVTTEGTIKILDFGLARIVEKVVEGDDATTLNMTHTGQIIGTPAYMSPEQAVGEKVDSRSDIFSFGIVMYEALTGERPFKGDNYALLISELLKSEPIPIIQLKPETPFLLSRLIMRCLDKARRHRPQSMKEVRAILEEIEAAIEAGVSIEKTPLPLSSKLKSGKYIWAVVILVLVVGAIAAFSVYRFTNQSPQVPLNFGNVALRKLSQSNDVVYAQITPDGKFVAYNTIEKDDERALWIRRVEEKNALQLLPPQRVSYWGGLTLSHDGGQIYYITAERDARHGTLYRISSLGGEPRKLVETVNDFGSLSPDGQRIVYVRYGEKMQMLSANAFDGSDERVIQTAGKNVIYRDPHFSPDGKHIFFIKFENINGEEFWSLIEIPATGGKERIILPARKPKISEIVVLKDGNGLLLNAVDPISNLQQLFHLSLLDAKETRITNDLTSYFGISVSDNGETIVSAQRHTVKDIWIASEKDKDNPVKLTNESNVYLNVAWTPDGKIVYDALDNNRPHIWIMNGDGTKAQQLTPNDSSDFEPRVTPDGRYIVFTSERTGERKIWRMNIDGSNPQLLTPVSGAAIGPVIKSDTQTVVFLWLKDKKRVLGEVPISGGEITEREAPEEWALTISPDGKQIAQAFYDKADNQRKVRVHPFDKETPSTVFSFSPYYVFLWTTDGKGLLYRKAEPGNESNSTIWFQPLTGNEPTQFLTVKSDSIFSLSQSKNGIAVIRGKFPTDAVMLTRIHTN